MKVEFSSNHEHSGAICIPVFSESQTGDAADKMDRDTGGVVRRAMDNSRFDGAAGELIEILAPTGTSSSRVIAIGLGPKKDDMRLAWEAFGAKAVQHLITSGETEVSLYVGDQPAQDAARAVFGAKLASYRFDGHRTKLPAKKQASLKTVRLVCKDERQAKSAYQSIGEVADGVFVARDLVSEPGNIVNPESFAQRVSELSKYGLEVEILDEKDMSKLGMNALLSVGEGSNYGSKLAIMKWHGGEKNEAPVVLVGKGVTFDTGGISLKPGAGMWDMKGDMGGAAAVTGAMRALAGRKAKANVIGIVGLVENMPDANATRPGDIVVSADGQTIEVQNTDAEGRLVLVDALWYGLTTFKPARIIDLATLTGAILVSLGHEHAGLFTNDDSLARDLSMAGEHSGEPVWRLPLSAAYDKLIDTPNADMKNIGGPGAGSITAAQFLKRFVGEVPWAHIDIAGTAWKDKRADPRDPVWATGYGVRLLNEFIASNHER